MLTICFTSRGFALGLCRPSGVSFSFIFVLIYQTFKQRNILSQEYSWTRKSLRVRNYPPSIYDEIRNQLDLLDDMLTIYDWYIDELNLEHLNIIKTTMQKNLDLLLIEFIHLGKLPPFSPGQVNEEDMMNRRLESYRNSYMESHNVEDLGALLSSLAAMVFKIEGKPGFRHWRRYNPNALFA
jgi:hypothetical protein